MQLKLHILLLHLVKKKVCVSASYFIAPSHLLYKELQ